MHYPTLIYIYYTITRMISSGFEQGMVVRPGVEEGEMAGVREGSPCDVLGTAICVTVGS